MVVGGLISSLIMDWYGFSRLTSGFEEEWEARQSDLQRFKHKESICISGLPDLVLLYIFVSQLVISSHSIEK